MSLQITVDRSAEFHIDARVRVTVEPHAAGPMVVLSTKFGGVTSTHKGATEMSYTLPADKQVELRISYVDANGNPATVDGAVLWDTSDELIAKVEPLRVNPQETPVGGAVMLVPGPNVGNCQISARADADLGEGTRELITLMDVTVVSGEAIAGVISPVGEPGPKP